MRIAAISALLLCPILLLAQMRGDSWEEVKEKKGGAVSALWYDFEPFTYVGPAGKMKGIEYELMEAFAGFVRDYYGYALELDWVDVKTFEGVYEGVRRAEQSGLFGVSYFSITDERQKEVAFAPPYMPDLNVLVTNNALPFFATSHEFVNQLPLLTGYTMPNTTMEEDMERVRETFYPPLSIRHEDDDYKIMEHIAHNKSSFGYVPLIVYLIGLDKGIRIKRQSVLPVSRPGFSVILPLGSDWKEPVSLFFLSPDFTQLVSRIVGRYLGDAVSALMADPFRDSLATSRDLGILALEKEIVTQKLIDAALDVEQQKNYRNLTILAVVAFVLIAGILYGRYLTKKRLNQELSERNDFIRKQKDEIGRINKMLEIKVLQAQLNPHFIFNSLNSIQYFVTLDEKKTALGYVTTFSRFLRQLFQSASFLDTSVEREISMLNLYLTLEKIRFSDRFTFSLECENEDIATQTIPSMLIHPFVEEALYQSVLNRNDPEGMISIRFRLEGGFVNVTIEDNGADRTDGLMSQGLPTGIEHPPHRKLVHDRIAFLHEQYGRQVSIRKISLTDKSGVSAGTRVTLHLPVKTEPAVA